VGPTGPDLVTGQGRCGGSGRAGHGPQSQKPLIAAGITFGVALTLLLSRLLTSMLFGISPTDGATLTLVSTGLAAVALLACYLQARRAARADPLVSIRHT
jgi:hypothetical protein